MKLAGIILLVGSICATGGFLANHWRLLAHFQPQTDRSKEPPGDDNAFRPARHLVSALGRLEPEGDVVDIGVGALSTDRLLRLEVVEGQFVKQGDVLAYLDSYTERVAEREHIASQLAEAKIRSAAETAHGQAQIREAEIAIEQVEKVQKLEIEAQEAKVRSLEAEAGRETSEMKRTNSLRPSAAATQQDYERQVMLARRTAENLAAARATLAKARAARDIDLVKAKAQLQTVRTALARTLAAIPLNSLTRQGQLADARVNLTVIRAPRAGQILKIRTRPGEATGVRPIVRLGNTAAMQAVAEVYHTDAGIVRVGQKARITSPALPGALTGKVVYVGNLIFKNDVLNIDPTADVDSRVVEVRIQLDESQAAAKLTYLQVNVEIVLDSAP
ncbi:MAG TPA: efflux RND transporter periplasmic adaptor subunit [Gemmataceae bacterium]|jgi:HlyD family secretion protein|nr:efflux RND transporter periplasmic adaptor subunit [Gemmataceae bacterium]